MSHWYFVKNKDCKRFCHVNCRNKLFDKSWNTLGCRSLKYFYFFTWKVTFSSVLFYFYLSNFHNRYFYFYLSKNLALYFYFYLSILAQYFEQHWQNLVTIGSRMFYSRLFKNARLLSKQWWPGLQLALTCSRDINVVLVEITFQAYHTHYNRH